MSTLNLQGDLMILTRLILIMTLFIGAPVRAEQITVFAAASLRNVLDEVISQYQSPDDIVVSYAGSSTLARQIQMGAPADIFLSANVDWITFLQTHSGLINQPATILASNQLVVIHPAHTTHDPLTDWNDWADTLGSKRIALAMIDAVPAGIYAKAALSHLGIWDLVSPNVVQSDNVRAALGLVALGAVDYGITYKTDALSEPKVAVFAQLPLHSHETIAYPAVLLTQNVAAKSFYDFLISAAARDIFDQYGFIAPSGAE